MSKISDFDNDGTLTDGDKLLGTSESDGKTYNYLLSTLKSFFFNGISLTWGNISGTLSTQADLQSALDAKQDTLTGLQATVTELNYTDGVTGPIQEQLDAKLPLTGGTISNKLTVSGGFKGHRPIIEEISVAREIDVLDSDSLIIATNDAGCNLILNEDDYVLAVEIDIQNLTNGEVTITPSVGVSINGAGLTITLPEKYSKVLLKNISGQDWVANIVI